MSSIQDWHDFQFPDFGGVHLSELGSFNSHPLEVNAAEESRWGNNQTLPERMIPHKPISSYTRLFSDGETNPKPNILLRDAPRPLEQHPVQKFVLGLFLSGITIPFLAYGSYSWGMHNKVVENENEWVTLNDFGNKLATAFPFVFSIIISRTIKQYAAWKLEKGTTLGALEQTMGSLTLGSTITTQFTIRRVNAIALFFLCIWALSPLGSQSSLQVLSVRPQPVISMRDMYYFNTDSTPGFESGDIWNGPSLNAIFLSCLMSPASLRLSSMDLWGNVKIPDISRLSHTQANSTRWLNLENRTNITFSSLLGIPLSNISQDGNSTFNMETSYLSLRCNDNITGFSNGGIDGDSLIGFFNYTSLTTGKKFDYSSNFTYYAINFSDIVPEPRLQSFQMAINGFYSVGTYGSVLEYINDTSTYQPRTLRFQSMYGNISAWCPITTVYVESSVKCIGLSCAVIAIRPSQLHHPNSNLTNLGFMAAFEEFSKYLVVSSTIQLHAGASTPLEDFIANPNSTAAAGGLGPSMQNISADDFGSRLQQVINTYWYGSYDPTSMMGFFNDNDTIGSSEERPTPISTLATHVEWQNIYMCHFGWLFALFFTTSVMLAAAILGTFLSFKNRGPDLLGYCSTIIRDSPFVQGIAGRSTMDGSERARTFGNTRLKIMDVEAEKEVGYITIAEDRGGEDNLIKGRYYA